METVLTLLLAGAILLAAEMVLPGAVAGIIGLLCLIAGVVTAYMTLDIATAHWILLGVVILLTAGTVAWFMYFPKSRLGKIFVSEGTVGEAGYGYRELLSQAGTAHTDLRPSGLAMINGKRFDVVSEGGFVLRGASVRVVQVEGNRIVVRPVT